MRRGGHSRAMPSRHSVGESDGNEKVGGPFARHPDGYRVYPDHPAHGGARGAALGRLGGLSGDPRAGAHRAPPARRRRPRAGSRSGSCPRRGSASISCGSAPAGRLALACCGRGSGRGRPDAAPARRGALHRDPPRARRHPRPDRRRRRLAPAARSCRRRAAAARLGVRGPAHRAASRDHADADDRAHRSGLRRERARSKARTSPDPGASRA